MSSWRYQLIRLIRRFEYEYTALNRIEVSKSALIHNARLVAANNPGLDIIPVLKSNAYGHGLVLVARALAGQGFPYVAVDGYFEGLRIRSATDQPVLVMGYIHPHNYHAIKTSGMAFVVHDATAIKSLGETRKPIKIHLELNTGMHRHGVSYSQLGSLLALIQQYPSLELEGVMSHLADADNETNEFTNTQAEAFRLALEAIHQAGFNPRHIHLAQTAGSTKIPKGAYTAVRLGIGLYGVNPLQEQDPQYKKLQGLKPAARMVSTIARINQVKKGDRVSYNGIWTAPKSGSIGVLPMGYYEGIPRALSNKGAVKLGNRFLPIVGRVCMNHMMIDLEDSGAKQFDEVVVISNDPADPNSIAGWQREHGLFAYTSMTGLGPDVRRILVD